MADHSAGCYLCRPDDPNAAEEACNDCDREFWKNPVAIYIGEDE